MQTTLPPLSAGKRAQSAVPAPIDELMQLVEAVLRSAYELGSSEPAG